MEQEEESVLGAGDLPLNETMEEVVYLNERIKQISNLHLCPNLRVLSLRRNLISAISGLEHAPLLEDLELYDNRLTKIENLHMLPRLRSLDLSYNMIKKIENLEALGQLPRLYLIANKIRVIENLEALQALEVLELSSNKIKIMQHLDALTGLKELWLNKNRIREIAPGALFNNLATFSCVRHCLQLPYSRLTARCSEPFFQTAAPSHPLSYQKVGRVPRLDWIPMAKTSIGLLCCT